MHVDDHTMYVVLYEQAQNRHEAVRRKNKPCTQISGPGVVACLLFSGSSSPGSRNLCRTNG